MKAIVISEFGEPEVLRIDERPSPVLKAYDVLIQVKTAGVNRPDVFQRKGNYPAPEGAPADIPGLEVAGIIVQVGTKASMWKVGNEVLALVSGGGYAEYVAADEGSCLPKPVDLTWEESAAIPETVFTVWHNLFQRGRLQPGEKVLIHGGAGGIGSCAIQLANAWGAIVYATAGDDEKVRFCESLGATRAINYKKDDFEVLLSDVGIDVILDSIGGAYFEKNINLLNPDGRLVYINATLGAKVQLNILRVMQNRLTITGSTLRSRDLGFKHTLAKDIQHYVFPLITGKRFKPNVSRVFTLSQAAEAHRLMESGAFLGKIVLRVSV